MPRLRAMIAAWLVWLPACVTMPRTSTLPSATTCDGSSSSATTITGPVQHAAVGQLLCATDAR